jgi:hypothetical protein
MLNLRAKVTNHGFQPSETAQELGLLLYRGVGIVCVATAAGNTTRDGKDTFGLVPGARSARMASIAAHFAPAAIDAAPHLQTFCPIGVIGTDRFWGLQRHHFSRRISRGFGRVSFWRDLNIAKKWYVERQDLSDTGFGLGFVLVPF